MARCGGCGVWGAVPVGCGRLACASCQGDLSHRRGDRLWERIGGAPMIGWVATVPPELAALWGWRAAARARVAFVALLERLYLEVALWDGLRGATRSRRHHTELALAIGAAIHPEGDERPGQWQPHIHAEISALCVADREHIRELPIVLAERRLAQLRRWWGAWLATEAEALGLPPRAVERANVHVSFRREPEKVRHRCRYDWRTFPGWEAGPDADGKRGALTPRRYGLAAPRADRLVELGALERWRAAAAGLAEPPEPPKCRAPAGETPEGEIIECGHIIEDRPQFWSGSRLMIEGRTGRDGIAWCVCELRPDHEGGAHGRGRGRDRPPPGGGFRCRLAQHAQGTFTGR